MTAAPTLIEWAMTGFKGARVGAATFGRVETAISVAGAGLVSTIFKGLGLEAGIAVGSAINASIPQPCTCPYRANRPPRGVLTFEHDRRPLE